MSEHRHFLLGLFFLIVFGGIGYYTLSHSDLSLFKYSKELSIYFPRAHGIQAGSSVEVAGVRWGKVTNVVFDPTAKADRRVVVTVDLSDPLTLRENKEILIKTATLLGGRVLTIDPGTVDRPELGEDVMLFGEVAPDPIEAIGELVRGNESALTEAIDGIRDLVNGLKAGDGVLGRLFVNEQLGEDLSRGLNAAANTFENADVVATALASGEGTLGQLLMNDVLYKELEEVGRNLRTISEDARVLVTDTRAGKGLVGRILTDDGLGEDVSEGLADLREIIGRINRGEGTLGRIVSGETIGENVDELLQRLVDGRGTFGQLFTDEQLYEDLSAIGGDIAAVTAKLRAGRGTIGRLVMDEELYDQLRLAVGLITRSLEEFRESAPISSMTSVIFGAF